MAAKKETKECKYTCGGEDPVWCGALHGTLEEAIASAAEDVSADTGVAVQIIYRLVPVKRVSRTSVTVRDIT